MAYSRHPPGPAADPQISRRFASRCLGPVGALPVAVDPEMLAPGSGVGVGGGSLGSVGAGSGEGSGGAAHAGGTLVSVPENSTKRLRRDPMFQCVARYSHDSGAASK